MDHHLLQPMTSSSEGCCQRRRLPPTPAAPPSSPHQLLIQQACLYPLRRSSSPRVLPTPPPSTPDLRQSSSSCVLLERRPSGRLLPRVPSSSSAPMVSPEALSLTPDLDIPRLQESPVIEPIGDFSYAIPHFTSYHDGVAPEDEEDEEEEEGGEGEEEECPEEGGSGQNTSQMPTIPLITRCTPSFSLQRTTSKSPVAETGGSKGRELGFDPSLYAPQQVNGRSFSISSAHSALSSVAHPVVSSTSFCGSEGVHPSGLGLLHCTLQHFPVRKRLRVNILKIEGLAGQLKPDVEMHAICKLRIVGMKSGKEQSSEVKRGRDPVFNQEFFFDNVMVEDLDSREVTIGAYHQPGAKLGKDILIGEVTIPLKEVPDLNSKKEIKVVDEFKQAINQKKLGKIHITSCVEKDARRLTINIKKAEDLPRWQFLGAPDVCVKITLVQGSAISKTKSSRILKSTTTAIYNEAVMFIFNPSRSELAHTKITISVHDMQRACTGDDIIGVAYLGILARDKSEQEQWKNTIEHMGKECKGTHHLKHPSLCPPTPQQPPQENVADEEDEEEREEGFEF